MYFFFMPSLVYIVMFSFVGEPGLLVAVATVNCRRVDDDAMCMKQSDYLAIAILPLPSRT